MAAKKEVVEQKGVLLLEIHQEGISRFEIRAVLSPEMSLAPG